MSLTIRFVTFLIAFPLGLLTGCGEKESETASKESAVAVDSAVPAAADTEATAAESQPSAAGQPADATSRPTTVEDIDRWQKGMAGEMEALQATAAQVKDAKSLPDKLALMEQANEGSTAPAGAKAAGVDEGRYDFIRAKLSGAVAHLAPFEGPGLDTASLPQSRRDQLRAEQDDYFKKTAWAVPPEVIEALKPRAAELRKQDMELAAARLKASGMQ
jgi:hypothetical protein